MTGIESACGSDNGPTSDVEQVAPESAVGWADLGAKRDVACVGEGLENLALHADMVHAHPSTERRRWALVEIDDGDVAIVREILLSDGEEFPVTGIHHGEAVGDHDKIEAGVRRGRAQVSLVQERDPVAVCGEFLPGLGKHVG